MTDSRKPLKAGEPRQPDGVSRAEWWTFDPAYKPTPGSMPPASPGESRHPDGTYKPTPADYDPEDREVLGTVEAIREGRRRRELGLTPDGRNPQEQPHQK